MCTRIHLIYPYRTTCTKFPYNASMCHIPKYNIPPQHHLYISNSSLPYRPTLKIAKMLYKTTKGELLRIFRFYVLRLFDIFINIFCQGDVFPFLFSLRLTPELEIIWSFYYRYIVNLPPIIEYMNS